MNIAKYMVNEIPSTFFVLKDLKTCGTNPKVVKTAAIIPITSMFQFTNQQYLQFYPAR